MPEVEIRPARPEDKAAVVAFCEDIWDGNDYIPEVWDDWLADSSGQTFVAVIDGKPVAIDRAAMLSDHEAWWQGLRVDPDYRGLGLVSKMDRYLVDYVRQAGATVIRLATSSENTIVHGMMDRRGFERVGRYGTFEAESVDEPVGRLRRLKADDMSEVRRFLDHSDVFAWAHRLFDSQGWTWQELTDAQLTQYAAEGLVWGIKEHNQLAGLAVLSTPEIEDDELWIGYVDGSEAGLAEMLHDLRRLAHQQGLAAVRGHFPALPRVFEALDEAGYEHARERELWLYEVPVSEINLQT